MHSKQRKILAAWAAAATFGLIVTAGTISMSILPATPF